MNATNNTSNAASGHSAEGGRKTPNLVPALLLIVVVVAIVAVCGIYAFSPTDETVQGQAEVTEYRVSSKVPGRVLAIMVGEGDTVHAGDTLALLEAPDVEAKLSQAQAAEEAAAALSRKAQKGARVEQINAAYEMWQKAKAGVEIAQKTYVRVKNLYEQGVTTAQKLDEATAQKDAAIATEKAAKAQYDMARNGAEREDKEAAAAQVNRAKGAVREVDAYVKETVLTASHDGEVTDIYPEEGELVGTGAPVMSVAMMDNMWITFNVREDHLSDFAMGQVVTATIPAMGNKEVKLKVYYMKDIGSYAAWKATKATGQYDMKTFEVRAKPLQKVEGLRPGMSVLLKK